MTLPKILTIDIESSPNKADVWSLWNVNVSLNQLNQPSRVICWSAKWYGAPKLLFASDHHTGHDGMVLAAHHLLDEADIVVGFNTRRFDIPTLNMEFLRQGLGPPSPVRHIDLLQVVKNNFRLASNKLQHVLEVAGLDGKAKHEGHGLWTACMAGDAKAWGRMRNYCKTDVVRTEQLYDVLKPWVRTHPNLALWSGEDETCPNCGSGDRQRRGIAYTAAGAYQQFRCNDCGAWARSSKSVATTSTRSAA